MNAVAFLLLTFYVPPLPTDGVVKQIALLGSPSYDERERATLALREMGHDALLAVWLMQYCYDPEISRRCQSLTDEFLSHDCYETDGEYYSRLSPWKMENIERFRNGRDWGKIYYDRARYLYNEWAGGTRGEHEPVQGWINGDIEDAAAQMLIRDMLWRGVPKHIVNLHVEFIRNAWRFNYNDPKQFRDVPGGLKGGDNQNLGGEDEVQVPVLRKRPATRRI